MKEGNLLHREWHSSEDTTLRRKFCGLYSPRVPSILVPLRGERNPPLLLLAFGAPETGCPRLTQKKHLMKTCTSTGGHLITDNMIPFRADY